MHAADGLKLDAIGGAPGATTAHVKEMATGKRPLWRKLFGLPPKGNHLMRLPEGVEGVFEPTVNGGLESEGKSPVCANSELPDNSPRQMKRTEWSSIICLQSTWCQSDVASCHAS